MSSTPANIDSVTSDLKNVSLDTTGFKINDKDEVPKLIQQVLDLTPTTSDTSTNSTISTAKALITTIGNGEGEHSLFTRQLRHLLHQYDAMHRFMVTLDQIGDELLINCLILLVAKDDELIGYLLKVNKEMLLKKPKNEINFQITLLVAIISSFQVMNSSYFINLSIVLPQIASTDPTTRSLVLLMVVKLNEIDSHQLEMTVLSFLEDNVLMEEDDNVLLITALTTLYPVLPCIATFINKNEQFKILMENNLSLISNHTKEAKFGKRDQLFVVLVLRFFATCCIDELMRKFILLNYYDLLVKLLDLSNDLQMKVLISLVITKCWNYTQNKYDLAPLLENFVKAITTTTTTTTTDVVELDAAVEGLLYLSLQSTLKESMRSDVELIDTLGSLLKSTDNNNSIKFGILNILTNLTQYAEIDDDDAGGVKKMFQKRKNMATGNKEEDEDESKIDSFIKSIVVDLINTVLISFTTGGVTTTKKLLSSPNLQLQMIKLIHNISYKRLNRALILKNAITFLLQFLTLTSSKDLQYEPETFKIKNPDLVAYPEERHLLILTLLVLLMSTDPNVVFKGLQAGAARTCVPFLCEVLLNSSEEQDRVVFNVLVALINLSSMDNEVVLKNLIIKIVFQQLQDLMLSSNLQICKTAIELVANLSVSPVLLEKFFLWLENVSSLHNFETMLQLLNHTNLQIQIATLNFFANVSEYNLICIILLDTPKFVDLIVGFTQEDLEEDYVNNDELIMRVVYILSNLAHCCVVEQDGTIDEKKIDKLKRDDLKKGIVNILQSSQDEEVLQMCVDICNIIKF